MLKDASEVVAHGLASLHREHPGRVELLDWDPRVLAAGGADVVLVDSPAATGRGVGWLHELVGASPAKVVPFVWRIDLDELAEAIAAGASGYLWKGLTGTELLRALDDICWGDSLPRPDASLRHRQIMVEFGLSKRELEVLALIARGMGNHEIAQTMFVSINSVKSYIRLAYRKIDVTRRSQAVRWTLENGLSPALPPQTVARRTVTGSPA